MFDKIKKNLEKTDHNPEYYSGSDEAWKELCERKDLDLSTVLVEMTYAGDPAKRLSTYSPQGGHFKALKDELVTLRQVDEKVRITIADGTFLKPGQKSAELLNIIAGIRDKGSDELKSELAFEINTYRGEEEYSPNFENLGPRELKKIKSKIGSITSKNGVAGVGMGNFVIYPVLNIYDEEVLEGGLEHQTIIRAEFTLFIQQVSNGQVYGEATVDLEGFGRDRSRALSKCIQGINVRDKIWGKFIKDSKNNGNN